MEFISYTTLFGVISFLNHGKPKDINVERYAVSPTFHILKAKNDIQKGEELLLDYCMGVKD